MEGAVEIFTESNVHICLGTQPARASLAQFSLLLVQRRQSLSLTSQSNNMMIGAHRCILLISVGIVKSVRISSFYVNTSTLLMNAPPPPGWLGPLGSSVIYHSSLNWPLRV